MIFAYNKLYGTYPSNLFCSPTSSNPYTRPYVPVYEENKTWSSRQSMPSTKMPIPRLEHENQSYLSSSDWRSSPSPSHPSIPSLDQVFSSEQSFQSTSYESDTITRKVHGKFMISSTPSGHMSKSGSYEIGQYVYCPTSKCKHFSNFEMYVFKFLNQIHYY